MGDIIIYGINFHCSAKENIAYTKLKATFKHINKGVRSQKHVREIINLIQYTSYVWVNVSNDQEIEEIRMKVPLKNRGW